eukprot:TRINITY_DN495_c0_g1_i1.p1 TRINITY_DN495_c0_g1~~TRINITY_DN495_c0_g1_i1.p1  ORF type:complete len:294 (+),score=79.75 TRINITY_DN495_c0_g1_i1:26-883(+)
MPMADTAKDVAKAPKRNGGKKVAKKAVEVALTGETVDTKPQAVETNPDPEPSTGEAVQTQPQVAETKPGPQPPTDSKNVYQPKEARMLMVFGCTPKVTKDAVRARWPSAEKFFFFTPKNLSVIFKTAAEAEAEAKAGMVEIAGEELRVAMRETPEQKAARMEIFQKKVLLASLPSGVTEADVLQAFPGAEGVILHKNKQKGEANGWATVTLRTAEAAAGTARVEVEVKGVKVTPFTCGLRPPATESSKKRKAAELSPTAQPSTATAEPGEASKPAKKKLKKAAAN